MEEKILTAKGISKGFNGEEVLSNINLELNQHETLVLMGPGGGGKSVLLKILASIIPPDTGEVKMFGLNPLTLSFRERMIAQKRTGFVFQSHALFDSLTIRDNIGFYGKYFDKLTTEEIDEEVLEMLSLVRLEDVRYAKPVSLSGGMRKRVGIARAIIHKPELLFLDDPTAGLDPITADAIVKVIFSLREKFGIAMVAVTNDHQTAKKIAHRIAILYDGRIYAIGTFDELINKGDEIVLKFLAPKIRK